MPYIPSQHEALAHLGALAAPRIDVCALVQQQLAHGQITGLGRISPLRGPATAGRRPLPGYCLLPSSSMYLEFRCALLSINLYTYLYLLYLYIYILSISISLSFSIYLSIYLSRFEGLRLTAGRRPNTGQK